MTVLACVIGCLFFEIFKLNLMNIYEYRIGNFLKSGKGIYRVAMIGKPDEIICEAENGKLIGVPAIYKPIKLTTDWLIKFGFIKQGESWILVSDHFRLFATKDTTFGTGCFFLNRKMAMSKNQVDFICNCQYVHRLQNIFHSLTGEDLKIKSAIAVN